MLQLTWDCWSAVNWSLPCRSVLVVAWAGRDCLERLSRLSCVTLTLQASQGLFTNTRLTLNTLLAVTSISTFISYSIQILHRLLSWRNSHGWLPFACLHSLRINLIEFYVARSVLSCCLMTLSLWCSAWWKSSLHLFFWDPCCWWPKSQAFCG